PVKLDPSQIDQVLANLCVNARDSIEGVGTITIETHNRELDEACAADRPGFVPGPYVLLSVSDTGEGMDGETLAHVFEPFFTTKDVGEGTGLGLAIVYGIVKQNDGYIDVYSEPREGTTFNLCFPRAVEEVVDVPAVSEDATPRSGTETLLLVEDEPSVLTLGKRILEGLGYTVLTAAAPVEAIRLVENHDGEIHLLITDVVMPGMNGRQLADRLAAMRPGLKRLYMSGYTADVIAERGVIDSEVSFIQKPYTKQALSAKVREALKG
ncbi:MAG: response regulator, partial [Candidatus Riflebacteria bacterium]|nr:response regulator [Candidatus Riflebacteria bacterium]